ncbi:hypothetical protein F5X68DRAFT_260037 [Plectosphaerella plurivora]|uniref:RING-type domain-containing protein n=1 Tax=Plectosphaerella plurivora TaxID=936078 RepID=A0A9P8VGB1_9PEZI|nr:hypothetical protein F5X68DRAFT_260037 [Plectosphaerella plurivora]
MESDDDNPGRSTRQGRPDPNKDCIDPKVPIDKPRDAFTAIHLRAMELGLKELSDNGGVTLTIGTMCSGTDAPILALREFQDAALADGNDTLFHIIHAFSVEIEAIKQGFIETNSKPVGEIFRDVVEVSDPDKTQATTAHGTLAPIPEAPDILVAGTSCVDFSGQNNQRAKILQDSELEKVFQSRSDKSAAMDPKGPRDDVKIKDIIARLREAMMDDKTGESTTTFVSVLTYLFYKRPKMVILENVVGAPWTQFSKHWLPLVGYQAGFVMVNSKNFLVPQTRQRGYLFAVDHRRYGKSSQKILDSWSGLMDRKWFKETLNLEAYLLDISDPKVLAVRSLRERQVAENITRDAEARMCSYEHAKARTAEGLGDSNPYTMRDARGNQTFREGAWDSALIASGTRIMDLLDIMHLRALNKKFDLTHKVATADVSQNVYRTKPKYGAVNCILPDGQNFILGDGRFISGTEALGLQGVPMDRVSTSVETQNQLHDLAGNAMTTTVVGTALLMALISEQKAVRSNDALEELGLQPISGEVPLQDRLFSMTLSKRNRPRTITSDIIEDKDTTFSTSKFDPKILDILRRLHPLIRRYCICRGYRKQNPGINLKVCSVCDEVRCESCAGNPKHVLYDHTVHATIPAEHVPMILRGLLPGRLLLHGMRVADAERWVNASLVANKFRFQDGSQERYLDRVAQFVCGAFSDLHYMDDISLEDEVTINFRSNRSTIRLVIGAHRLTWLIFSREDLVVSVFENEDEEENVLGVVSRLQPMARCEINYSTRNRSIIPQPHEFQLHMPGTSKITLDLAPGNGHMEIDIANWWKSGFYDLSFIEGGYAFSSECSTPLGLLYSLHTPSGNRKAFLYLDSHPTRPEEGRWIIATTIAKQCSSTHRQIICTFPKDFEMPQEGDKAVSVECVVDGCWVRLNKPEMGMAVEWHPENEWVAPVGDLYRHFPDVQQRPVGLLHFNLQVEDLRYDDPVFKYIWDCRNPPFRAANPRKDTNRSWIRVPETYQMNALALVKHALHLITRSPTTDEWYVDVADVSNFQALDKDSQLPQAYHRWIPLPKGHKGANTFNDPDSIMASKEKYASRPLPIEIDVRLDIADHEHVLDFRISFNPTALAHQAWMALPHDGFERGIRRQATHESRLGVRVDVRVKPACLKTLRPFTNVFHMKRPKLEKDAFGSKPRSFAKTGHTLYPAQQRTLEWMLSKENVGEKFMEQEIVEHNISSSDMRIVAFAKTANRARGGVLGHDVGFGKTIVTLALIDRKSEGTMRQLSIDERISWTGQRHIHLKGTLILCPPQIVKQWKSEAHKFLGRSWNVLTISKESEIDKAELEAADIIILNSNILCKPSYLRDFTRMTGGPPKVAHDKLTDRAFNDLYRRSLDRLGAMHEAHTKNPHADIDQMVTSYFQGDEKTLADITARSVPESTRAGAKKARKDQAAAEKAAADKNTEMDTEEEVTTQPTVTKTTTTKRIIIKKNTSASSAAGPGPATATSRGGKARKLRIAKGTTPASTGRPKPMNTTTTAKATTTVTETSTHLKATTAGKAVAVAAETLNTNATVQPRRSSRNQGRALPSMAAVFGSDDEDDDTFMGEPGDDTYMAEPEDDADQDVPMDATDDDEDASDPETGRGPAPIAPMHVTEETEDEAESEPESHQRYHKKPVPTVSDESEDEDEDESESESDAPKRTAKRAARRTTTKLPNTPRNVIAAGKLLQLYSFARVVLDEFSYENTAISTFFTNVIANAKWILSGTPPLGNLKQVCSIGSLLNIHVARTEPLVPDYFPLVTEGPVMDAYTQAEKFRSYGEPMSTNFALERHEQALKFLIHKLQRRETNTSHIEVKEEIVVVNMDPTTTLVYALLQQALYDAKWDIDDGDLSEDMSNLITAMLKSAYGKDSVKKASQVREHLRVSWKKAVQTLLIQASSNLSLFSKTFNGGLVDTLGHEPEAKDFLAHLIDLKTQELDDHKKRLKSHFDALMYCTVRAKESLTWRKPHVPKKFGKVWYEKQVEKNDDYTGHFNALIERLFAKDPKTKSDPSMLSKKENWTDPTQWQITASEHSPADWYLLKKTDFDEMPADEYDRVKDQAEKWRQNLPQRSTLSTATVAGIIAVIAAHRRANPEDVAAKCGLIDSSPTKFFQDKLKSSDFQYGSKLYPFRPHKELAYKERSATIDQAVTQRQMLLQTVNVGIAKFVAVSRSLSLLTRLADLSAKDPSSGLCDVCDGTGEDDELEIFVTCGHVLCPNCAADFHCDGQAQGWECPATDCNSVNDGALIRCGRLVEKEPSRRINFDGCSAKTTKIVEVIEQEVVPAGEKALVFTSDDVVKKELAGALAAADVAVFQTTGSDKDAAAIRKFKAARGSAVLLQSLMSSESAGTNLTEANHVLFAAPLHTDTRNYFMYVRQAEGRVVRQGQSRAVRVYHFVTAHTMEVEVLEGRLRHRVRAPMEEEKGRIVLDGRGHKSWARQLLFGTANSEARRNGEPGGEGMVVSPLNPGDRFLPLAGTDDAAPPSGSEEEEDDDEERASARPIFKGQGGTAVLRAWLEAVGEKPAAGVATLPTAAKTPAAGAVRRGALCSFISSAQVDKVLGSQEYEEWRGGPMMDLE